MKLFHSRPQKGMAGQEQAPGAVQKQMAMVGHKKAEHAAAAAKNQELDDDADDLKKEAVVLSVS